MKIKIGLEQEYAEYVKKNSENGYSKACVDAGEMIGNALDEGKTPEEAEETLHGKDLGLTGFMVGAAMQGVVYFNPRGEEMKIWWNKFCGGSGEEKGTIIMTIRDNKN